MRQQGNINRHFLETLTGPISLAPQMKSTYVLIIGILLPGAIAAWSTTRAVRVAAVCVQLVFALLAVAGVFG
jgi:hypothetical protein